ncbi:hypothetical protein VMCG_04850 [Cytospora schulzeri]|uniref:Protein kinase domain-containing protein n=1 Tax=Cytospora schulzeri TaxID=448051 RepID=A0A423WMY4_9PEZI|nr:hypothetical protein VMCG_04850 [Valsa malicola]
MPEDPEDSSIPTAGASARPHPPNPSDSEEPLDYSLPRLPYIPGACFDIKPHNPPPPFGLPWYTRPSPDEWNYDPWPWREGAPETKLEMCLKHKPRKTTPPQDQAVHRLQVTRQIRCGEEVSAQLVECRLGGSKTRLVAKIFDPLYVNDDGLHTPTYFAERYYAREAAAYMRIKERGLDGKFTPKFEGCWVFEIPLRLDKNRVVRREVRLILQQFIPGDTVQNLIESGEAQKISFNVRMELMARLMETFSHLDFIGVRTEDPFTRNVMVHKDSQNEWHITLIDFSHSRVLGLETSKWLYRQGEQVELPISPIAICSGHWPVYPVEDIQEHWIDPKYRDRKTRRRWMDERWGKASGKSSQYQPVDETLLYET